MMVIKCDVCDAHFPTNARLYAHKLTHEEETVPEHIVNDLSPVDLPINGINSEIQGKVKRQKTTPNRTINHNKDLEIKKLKEELKSTENDYQELVKLLNNQIRFLEFDGRELETTSTKIYSDKMISKIKDFWESIRLNKFSEIYEGEIKVVKLILMGLSYGAIPVTKPQRDRINNSQRNLVDEIIESPARLATEIIKNNEDEIVDLFFLISDSLKFAVESYEKFSVRGQAKKVNK